MLLLSSGGSWQPSLPQEITLSTAVAGRRLAVRSTLHPTAWAALQPFGSDLQRRLNVNNCTELSLPVLQREDSLQHPPVPSAERGVHRVQAGLVLSCVAPQRQENAHSHLQGQSRLHRQLASSLHGLSVQAKATFLKKKCYLCLY